MTSPANVKVPNWAVIPITTAMLTLGGMWYHVSVLEGQKEDKGDHATDVADIKSQLQRILDVVCVGKEQSRPCKGNP